MFFLQFSVISPPNENQILLRSAKNKFPGGFSPLFAFLVKLAEGSSMIILMLLILLLCRQLV